MFYERSMIVEEVKAWKKCPECDKGVIEVSIPPVRNLSEISQEACPDCNGEGGKWHEAIEMFLETLYNVVIPIPCIDGIGPVVETDTLVREHEVCKECQGVKRIGPPCINGFFGRDITRECDHCLKDVHGNPTGAEPGTATLWEWGMKEESK